MGHHGRQQGPRLARTQALGLGQAIQRLAASHRHSYLVALGAALAGRALVGAARLGTHVVPLFALSCLLHIMMDSLTPMGVPKLNPFGNKGRLPLGWMGNDLVFLLFWLPAMYVMYRYGWTDWIARLP
ncbi:MAG: metal-dependent hydrolase [Fimbriimonadales bacterium]|nr:metal-dependent hydrolase [Fimbriimonadales bacterium]